MNTERFDEFFKLLVELYHQEPNGYFHERELHGAFFGIARPEIELIRVKDGPLISPLRYEYNSFHRYKRDTKSIKLSDSGKTACFDFAYLNKSFIENHELISVVNKDEFERKKLRVKLQNGLCPIDFVIEFKMLHFRNTLQFKETDWNNLIAEIAVDIGKILLEDLKLGILAIFSHGSESEEDCRRILDKAVRAVHEANLEKWSSELGRRYRVEFVTKTDRWSLPLIGT